MERTAPSTQVHPTNPRIEIIAKVIWDTKDYDGGEPEWDVVVDRYPGVAERYRSKARKVDIELHAAGL